VALTGRDRVRDLTPHAPAVPDAAWRPRTGWGLAGFPSPVDTQSSAGPGHSSYILIRHRPAGGGGRDLHIFYR